jgi:large subunit ribosomal protein L24e
MSVYATVKARRERVFYKQRMAGNRQRQLETDKKLVEENQHLLPLEYRTMEEEAEVPEQALQEEMDVDLEEDIEEELQVKMKGANLKQARKLKMKVGGGFEED